jgi:diaminopimelate decarboxylase
LDHFLYRHGQLHAEDVPLREIAETVGTPFYCYSSATLTRHYTLFTEALSPLPHLVCFAVKSLSNVAVLKLLGDLGAGMDVVSEGEYRRAIAAGVPGDRIVFSGVGKTRAEMALPLTGGIRQFNVESEPELRALSEVAAGWARPRPSRCGSTPMSTPRPMKRSAPAAKRTSSASHWSRPATSMPWPPACRGCGSSGSTCISAAS